MKICERCKKLLPYEDFEVFLYAPTGRAATCNVCRASQQVHIEALVAGAESRINVMMMYYIEEIRINVMAMNHTEETRASHRMPEHHAREIREGVGAIMSHLADDLKAHARDVI